MLPPGLLGEIRLLENVARPLAACVRAISA